MKPLRFTRRRWLRGTLATTALLPWLEARRLVSAQSEPIRRLVVFTMPNGTRNDMFWPTGSGASYELRPLTAPLEPFKSKLTFLKGVRLNDSLQDGALGGTLGSEHARGTGGMLTARPLNSGTEFVSFGNTTSGWGSGQSIDQYLVDRLAPPTTFSSLQLGVHVRDTEVRARISYRASNQPIPPREDPADVFATLFGGATGTPAAPSAELSRLWAQRKSVFDLTNAETQRISQLVGAEDRQKLDAHLTAMREVEQRLTGATGAGSSPGTGTGSCAGPAMQAVDLRADDQYEAAGRHQMDLAAAALACDLTRILTFQWSYSESEHLFPFLSISGNHHGISHDFSTSGTNFEAYNAIQVWYAERLAYFLGKLDSYREGDATLLDNTLVLWATEIGEATSHDLRLMPYVLAGSAGGRIRAGRLVDYGSNPRDNNQLLVSIAHALGADDLTRFGDESGAAGPLPDLA
jgi:hypothetical protein